MNSETEQPETALFPPQTADSSDAAPGVETPKEERWFRRLQRDQTFRRRVIHTAFLCWTFVAQGWVSGMLGPTFPDIRLIIDKDLEAAAWFFSVGAIGFPIGALLGGVLFDRYNKTLLLALSNVGFGVGTIVTPWCSNFPLMLAVRLIAMLFCGSLDTGAHAALIEVWGSESAPYMQALHFSFSFGALVSPFATEPFLVEMFCQPVETRLQHAVNYSSASKDGLYVEHATWSEVEAYNQTINNTSGADVNNTSKNSNGYEVFANMTVTVQGTNTTQCIWRYGETKVHYAFLIAGLFLVVAAVCLLFLFLWSRTVDVYMAGGKEGDGDKNGPKELTMKAKIVFLILLPTTLMLYCVAEDATASFLMTFGLDYLGWDKLKGSLATGMFWTTFAAGRFCGIFVVHFCSQLILLCIALTALIVCHLGICIGATIHIELMVWVSLAALGFFMSVVFPSILSWTSENIVKLSGKVVSLFHILSSLGAVVFPLLMGHMMETYTPMWFVYLLLITASATLLTFLVVLFLQRVVNFGQVDTQDEGEQEIHMLR